MQYGLNFVVLLEIKAVRVRRQDSHWDRHLGHAG